LRWKIQRESDPREALKRLREVSPSVLRKIVAEGLERRDARLLSALDRLDASDKEAAFLMRGLVDELTESYTRMRQSLSPEIMESFVMAVDRLPSSEIMEKFTMAVSTLSRIKETLDEFNVATYRLKNRPEFGEY
jgi:hypothetical protein